MGLQFNSELNLVNVTASLFIYSLFNLIVLKYWSTCVVFILLLFIILINLLSLKNKLLRDKSFKLYIYRLYVSI